MTSPEHLSSQDGPRLRLKPIVSEDVEALIEALHRSDADYPGIIDCWTCNARLVLEDVKYDWPVGPYRFYFPDVPAYYCNRCERTYFPEAVREALSRTVEKELDQLELDPPRRNPRNEVFARRLAWR